MRPKPFLAAVALILAFATRAWAQAPVIYHLSFPEPEHRFARVDVVFSGLDATPLEVRMSRSSPGRYALHEFAKNVYDVRMFDGGGRPVLFDRPNAHQWTARGHDGTVRVTYRVYGDRLDGTFLAIDTTHAHLNMPATLMWARGLENRPIRITFERPVGTTWNVATQLHVTDDPLTFTAANLQYLMDSPVEFSAFTTRTFKVAVPAARAATEPPQKPDPSAPPPIVRAATIKLALHHTGTDRQADELAADVAKLVREAGAVFGEFPSYDVGYYTFLADYLPYASGDGMEHRNSTVVTSTGALGDVGRRLDLLGTIAHEFVHGWNVERVRPRSLEPFNFEEANISGELWLAEGFTTYYQSLLMRRAGLASLDHTAAEFAQTIDVVTRSPARALRTVVDMSRLAPFVDAARWVDRTNWDNVYISYYTWGAALGLGLDLALRDHTSGRVTLDDYMRAMWQVHGRPAAAAEGLVAAPYTLQDARDRLAEVSRDRAFADEFFGRFVEGREIPDYARLLQRAGLVLRKQNSGRAWLGDVRLTYTGSSARLAEPAPFGSPIYRAGLDQDDEILAVDGERLSASGQLEAVLRRHRPGDTVSIAFLRRAAQVNTAIALEEDPTLEVVPAERAGRSLTAAERSFRDAWLNSRQ